MIKMRARLCVEQALNELVARHDALRLRFAPPAEGRGWEQRVLDSADPRAQLAVERVDGPADVEALCDGIDLGERPLRAVLLSPHGGPVRLLLAAHPLVLDSRSFYLLVEDLAATCEAIQHLAPLPPPPAMASFRKAGDKGGEKTVVGYVSDSMCGLDHAPMKLGDDKTCTLKCVEGGAKFVLADRAHKVVYALDDAVQEQARELAGQKVQVTGQVDAKAKTIHVTKIEAAK